MPIRFTLDPSLSDEEIAERLTSLARDSVAKHSGPGSHPSGSPQSAHGGDDIDLGPPLDLTRRRPSDRELLRRWWNSSRRDRKEGRGFQKDELKRLTVILPPEKRSLAQVAFAKHGGPGPHQNGTEQTVHGRRGGGGSEPAGGPLSLFEDPDLVKSVYDEAYSKYGQRIEHISQVAGLDKLSSTTSRGGDTMGLYGKWSPDGHFLGWTPERIDWQNETLLNMMDAQEQANGRPPKQEKQAIVMAGLPGAGKTHILKGELGGVFDLADYVVVNADEVKERIIFDDAPPQVSDLEGMELSTLVHEESSDMSKRWERMLVSDGYNIALDITAANREGTLRRISALQDQGYTVHVVHVDITPEEAMASTMRRSGTGATTPGKVGRPVPPKFIEAMALSSGKDVIDEAFDSYAQAANGEVFAYRNFPISRKAPVLTYTSRNP